MSVIPLVIVEGPDYSGKSTLVEEIRSSWERNFPDGNVKIQHNGPPGPRLDHETEEAYSDRLMQALLAQIERYSPESAGSLYILDRAHLSNWVYGNLFRPEASRDGWAELGEHNFELIEEAYTAKGGVLALLLPSTKILTSRDLMRGDEYLDSLIEKDKAAEPRAESPEDSDTYPTVRLNALVDSHAVRRVKQLTQVSAMYDIWMQEHARKQMTFRHIGHPLYVDADLIDSYQTQHNDMLIKWDKDTNQWPVMAFETDVRRVANYILDAAIDVQKRLLEDIACHEAYRESDRRMCQSSTPS